MNKDLFVELLTSKYAACGYCINADLPSSCAICQNCLGDVSMTRIRTNFALNETRFNESWCKE